MSRRFLDPAAEALGKAEQALDRGWPELAAAYQDVAAQWAELARIDKHRTGPKRQRTTRSPPTGSQNRPGHEADTGAEADQDGAG